ncbi:hypothetical protein [Paenibacillus gansuensis]|uniref:Uncharacterized protein n=1 Tax=Paenibacillus gansuensis TaxID=306542 RepID=A0ABW5PGP8_9BACL
MIEKYIGRYVDIIYQNKIGKISQRRIKVNAVQGALVKAFCTESKSFRTFMKSNILALDPNQTGVGSAS